MAECPHLERKKDSRGCRLSRPDVGFKPVLVTRNLSNPDMISWLYWNEGDKRQDIVCTHFEGDDVYAGEQNDFKTVFWVRHCESCANTASVTDVEKRFLREPMCTSSGAIHAIMMGIRIGKQLQVMNVTKVGLYCSYLVRTMETAKLLAIGIHLSNPYVVLSDIVPICHVSEFPNKLDASRSGTLGSGNRTTAEKAKIHAEFLNRKMPSPSPQIVTNGFVDDDGCGMYREGDYVRFLDNELKEMKNKVNIVVSHGGYIRKNVLQTTDIHPMNTEVYRVEYKKESNSGELHANVEEIMNPMENCDDVEKATQTWVDTGSEDDSVSGWKSCNYKFRELSSPSSSPPSSLPTSPYSPTSPSSLSYSSLSDSDSENDSFT